MPTQSAKGLLTSELLVVTWRGPLALLDHLVDGAADLGTSSNDVVDGELVKGTSVLDVLQSSLEVLELGLDLGSGSLSLLNLFCSAIEPTKGIRIVSILRELR